MGVHALRCRAHLQLGLELLEIGPFAGIGCGGKGGFYQCSLEMTRQW